MKNYSIFVFLLILILGILSIFYLNTWQEKQEVNKFLKDELPAEAKSIEEPIITKEDKFDNINEKDKKLDIQVQKTEYEEPKISFTLESEIIADPQAVTTHINSKKHFFFQDKSQKLYFLDNNGKCLWKKNLEEKLLSPIYEIDYYKNKKIQYMFLTESNLYLLDYNGRRIRNFPKKIINYGSPQFLNIVDYSGTKNYRFMVSTKEGKIILYDKYMKMLPGWNPNDVKDDLVRAPKHVRIKNKDYFVIVTKSGKIYLKNRKGSNYNSSIPIDTKMRAIDCHIYKGSNNQDSKISCITEDKKILEYSFDGNQINNELENTKVSIIQNIDNKLDNLYMIIDNNQIKFSTLDKSKEYTIPSKQSITGDYSYFKFKKGIVFIEKTNENIINIYNKNGKKINKKTIISDKNPKAYYDNSSDKLVLVTSYHNNFNTYEVDYM